MTKRDLHNTWISRPKRWGVVGCLLVGLTAPAGAQQADREDAADTQGQESPTPVEGEQDRGTVDPADTQPDETGLDEEGAEAELASAARLQEELSALLSAKPGAAVGEAGLKTKLAGLATRSEVLANSAMSQEALVLLLRCQAQVNAVLADAEVDAEMRDRRLISLRNAARKLGELDIIGIGPESDYWLLLADLADASQLDANSVTRQSLSEQLLTGYIDQYKDMPIAAEFVADARLSRAALLDRRGDQAGVVEELEKLAGLPDDGPRSAQAKRLYNSTRRIGTPVSLEGVTTRLDVWRLADHLGQPVLLHVYADAAKPSADMIAQISKAIATRALSGFRIVSLRVGEPEADAPTAPWPTLPIDFKPGGVLEQLNIEALPTLAWIDGEGKLASIGNTLAVLEQMPSATPAQPAEAEEPEPEPEPEFEPGADQPDAGAAPGADQSSQDTPQDTPQDPEAGAAAADSP